MEFKGKSVVFGTCRGRMAYYENIDSMSLAQMILMKNGVNCAELSSNTTYIHEGRESIKDDFLALDWPSHLCYIDSDNVLHPETVIRLMQHDVDIVSALYFKRNGAPEPVAFTWSDDDRDEYYSLCSEIRDFMVEHNMPGSPEPQCVDEDYNMLMEADVVGFGCVLIKREVLESMEEHYGPTQFGGHGEPLGEDAIWCKRAQDLGYKIHVDLGAHIGHITTKQISSAHFLLVPEWIKGER